MANINFNNIVYNMTDRNHNLDELDTQYYTVNSFNEISNNCNTNFYVFHQNIQSFHAHSVEFEAYIDQLDIEPDIIAFSETWFKENTITDLKGYYGFHSYRERRNGGGVSVYAKDKFNCNEIEYLNLNDETCETCAIQIQFTSSYKIVILCIYT